MLDENSDGVTWKLTGETTTYTTLLRSDRNASARKSKPNMNTENSHIVKLILFGAELVIKYTAEAAAALPPVQS